MTNDIDYNQLGKRIKRYRLKAHLTQEQLAEKTDVATSTIAHAENGTSKPSLPLLLKVANLLYFLFLALGDLFLGIHPDKDNHSCKHSGKNIYSSIYNENCKHIAIFI